MPMSLPARSDRNHRCSSTWWNTSAGGRRAHSSSGTAATAGSNTSSRQRAAATDSAIGRPARRSAASRWRDEVFEPTVAAVPEELWGRLPPAEVFHQVLEHRWFLSEQAGKDVGIDEAVRSYVASVLPGKRPERVVLESEQP